MIRQDFTDYFSIPSSQIRLVYNGINTSRFRADITTNLREKLGFDAEILFLFMAYDFRKKGVSYLVEAAARLRDRVGTGKFGVIVVGGSPDTGLLRLVKDYNLTDIVVFPGPTKTPEEYYSACDVFVLPTFYDACSLVVFEAMSAGLPAITTTFNGASGIITNHVDGEIIEDPSNVDRIAEAMLPFLDKAFLKEASTAAKRTAAQYTLEENHRKMLEIFWSCLGKS